MNASVGRDTRVCIHTHTDATPTESSYQADPLVVWTDGRSASASEILASALRDNCRAVLMGKKTFGKGLVQGVFGLSDGKGLVMTVARYETPRGASIQVGGMWFVGYGACFFCWGGGGVPACSHRR